MRSRITDIGIMRGYTRLHNRIVGIEKKIDQLLKLLSSPVKLTQNEKLILLSLPTHLIKTYFTLDGLGGTATATEISNLTRKARAVESSYLNILVIMGYLVKDHKGRKVVFSIDNEHLNTRVLVAPSIPARC